MTANAQHSADVVRSFFAAFGSGDIDGLVALFDPAAEIVAVRPGPRRDGDIHGSYSGRDGARAFVANLGAAFDTKAFAVDDVIADGDTAFASGSFTHVLRTTGKPFSSAWALRCTVRDGRIVRYHFYEDSEAYVRAAA